jgi:hypothetical protein
MDAEFALVASRSVAAALLGRSWIDEDPRLGLWERRYYISVFELRESNVSAWETYRDIVNQNPVQPSSARRRTLKRVFGTILMRNGINLYPF